MIKKLIKLPILKRLIPSIAIRLLKLINKNRGYFNINGVEMYLDFLDPLDRKLILNQSYEIEETKILLDLVNRNSLEYFIDIGANSGYYSIELSKKNFKVLAFEPNLEALFKLNKTLNVNNNLKNKIKIFPFGLSDKDSKLLMKSKVKFGYIQPGGSSVTESTNEKNYKTFHANFKKGDEVLNLIDKNLAIKIDVEGHELKVLNGMINVLKTNKCILLIEIFQENFDEINRFLIKNNFKLINKVKKRFNYFYQNF
jgi:FkbM family methyltransferase